MTDVFRSWAGWECIPLPADGAEVLSLNGMPPEGTVSFSQRPDLLEVLFCHSGEAKLDVSGGRHLLLRSGQVLFFPCRSGACCCQFTQEPFQGVLVQETEQAAFAALSVLWPGRDRAALDQHHGCTVIDAALWSEALFFTLGQLPAERRGNYCAMKVLELLYMLHSADGLQPGNTQFQYLDHWQAEAVQKIHNYMLEHLDQRLTIQRLSKQFRISGTNLKSYFRQIYGASIHQYFLERRMSRAAQLLCATDQTVLQIASAVGYSSASQFGVAFKARYHLSPAQFRRAFKKISIPVCSCPNQSEKDDPDQYNTKLC
ncbi:MAG TPA: helix-turn-helix domain-containing protein [Candidatus Oscillibacter pullicola]|nr:helix-turn-helix domain-containing protein [Candidatus Oscillibacter pullicola]